MSVDFSQELFFNTAAFRHNSCSIGNHPNSDHWPFEYKSQASTDCTVTVGLGTYCAKFQVIPIRGFRFILLTCTPTYVHIHIHQWCGLRSSVLGQDRSETQKIGLGLAGLMWCCETRSYHAGRHNDLEGHSNFSSTIYSFSILCLEVGTSLYCRDQPEFTDLKVKSARRLCLLPVVLVLRIWSCLHHWHTSWQSASLYPTYYVVGADN